jgi:hypothetical protein
VILRRIALFTLALCLAAGAAAQTAPKKPSKASRPAWAELTADQQMILAPLKEDWANLDPQRRRKWVGIAKRYPNMEPREQERVQRRMQRWAALTPEQRAQARENYKRIAKQRAEKRNQRLAERWAEYQALPPHERANILPPPQPRPQKN